MSPVMLAAYLLKFYLPGLFSVLFRGFGLGYRSRRRFLTGVIVYTVFTLGLSALLILGLGYGAYTHLAALVMPSESAKTQQYTQPTAPAASSVTIDYANETVSFAGTLEVYTAQIGGTPIISSGSISNHIPDAGSSAQTVCVRVKAVSGGAPESEWTAVAIPARPANGAALTVDTAAETVTVPAGYSYQIGSGSAVGVSADTAVTLAPGTMLTCWKTAAVSAFKSAGASVTAPARLAAVDSASFTINAIAEKLPTTAGMAAICSLFTQKLWWLRTKSAMASFPSSCAGV